MKYMLEVYWFDESKNRTSDIHTFKSMDSRYEYIISLKDRKSLAGFRFYEMV